MPLKSVRQASRSAICTPIIAQAGIVGTVTKRGMMVLSAMRRFRRALRRVQRRRQCHSASLSDARLPFRDDVFAEGCFAYEVVCGKGMTPFLAQARTAGAGCLADGVGMLVEQAAEAFRWWCGVRPETALLIADLTVPLTGSLDAGTPAAPVKAKGAPLCQFPVVAS